jgi:hypothetical protein
MNNLKKEFVPYTEALELKQLGFDEPCLASWNFYTREFNYNGQASIFSSEDVIQLPTFSQCFRWFREKHGYCSYIKEATKGTYRFYIEKFDEKFFNSSPYKIYEEAELACLRKLIEIVKQKQQ